MTRRIGAATTIAGLVLVTVVAVPFAKEFVGAERCLDAGGSFNYVDAVCDRAQTHPFIPYSQRHPAALPAAAAGLALASVGALMRFAVRPGQPAGKSNAGDGGAGRIRHD